MSNYQPGTVAWATVRGQSSYKVMRVLTSRGLRWVSTANDAGQFLHEDDDLTDIRPLVVLDLMGHSAEVLEEVLAGAGFADLADQIEAQTKLPRIPEPGLWGVVEAKRDRERSVTKYLRRYDRNNGGYDWTPIDFSNPQRGESFRWSDLIDPTLIREGVSA